MKLLLGLLFTGLLFAQAPMPGGNSGATGGAPTGAAGGDLSGTYPNPAVAAIGGKTVTLSGNFTTTGAFNPTFAVPSSSTWTFPAGPSTLMSTATVLASGQVPTFTGDVTASGLALTVGAIGGKTVSLGGNLAITGAFNPTFAIPSSSTWTFPAGPSTLMSTATVLGSAQVPTFTGDVTASGLALTVGAIGGKTVSLSGNLATTGAFNPTFAIPSSSTWTFPAGPSTLMSTATVLASGQVPTFTGDVTASGLALTVGAIGGKTVSLSGNLATTGAFNPTFAIPSTSTYTFPTGTSSLNGVIYKTTTSSSPGGNIGATAMVTPGVDTLYRFAIYWAQTTVGTGCTTATTVWPWVQYTEAATGNAQVSGTFVYYYNAIAGGSTGTPASVSSANGAMNFATTAQGTTVMSHGSSPPIMINAKAGVAVNFGVNYSLGSGCSGSNPAYTVTPILQTWN